MKLYKRLSVLLTMGIMGIGLISFSTVPQASAGTGNSDNNDQQIERAIAGTNLPDEGNSSVTEATPTSEPTPSPTPEATPTPAPNYLQKNSNSKITKLVDDYLKAKLTCTREAFEGIVTDTGYINVETLMIQTETVLSYDLLDCYVKRGFSPVDFVVYYTYNMNIATLSSPVLAIDSLYVRADENGDYRVFLGRLDDDVEAQLDELNKDDDVQAVLRDVSAQISQAMDEDETLLQYWQRLYERLGLQFGGGDQPEE
ncbi:MAG: hypothetical protein K6E62_08050 [Lachnospiraceae bacterium]|nr:hypothetical protein [Lachnospiraceae bacterium]